MNRYVLVVLSISMILSFPVTAIEASELRDEVEKLLNTYIAAEVTAVTQGRIVSGWSAIQRETELAAQSQKPPQISLGAVAVSPLGQDHALAVAEYTVRIHLTQGPLSFSGAWTVVLERDQGQWKIFHEHHSDK